MCGGVRLKASYLGHGTADCSVQTLPCDSPAGHSGAGASMRSTASPSLRKAYMTEYVEPLLPRIFVKNVGFKRSYMFAGSN